ncbi:MAG: phytoene desaturase [Balneolaceae bacterium]|nr:MAG: phytoene desaturase [Balneolaceae bacterium]
MKKILVIGAGIGGLSAAALLAAKGHSVTVIERNARAGGKMNEFRRDGFRFDTGPSLMTMPFVLEDLFGTCGKKLSDYVNLIPLDQICRYHYADGTIFNCYADREKTLQEIRRIAPEDSDAYIDFLGYCEKIYERTTGSFLENPLYSFSDFRNLNFADLLKIDALTTVSKRVDRVFRSDYMRMFFKRFTTYNGSSPFLAPATLNVIPHVELTLGGYYLNGGLYSLAEALERLGSELGVEFRYNESVRQITGKDRTVQGVITGTGEEITCDAVFSNSDAAETYSHLLTGNMADRRMRRKVEKAEPSCSGFVLLLGSDRKFDSLGHHTIFYSGDYKKEFDDLFVHMRPSEDPTIYVANTSHTEPGHAPAGMSNLFVLVNAPYLTADSDWESQKDGYALLIIKQLEQRGLTGLGDSLRVQSIITPADFYENYRSNRGSIYGTSSNDRLSAFRRPANKARSIRGLYLTGGSTHPGGGIPLTVLSARHAVTLFQRDN